jgi:hypothetical protein
MKQQFPTLNALAAAVAAYSHTEQRIIREKNPRRSNAEPTTCFGLPIGSRRSIRCQ